MLPVNMQVPFRSPQAITIENELIAFG